MSWQTLRAQERLAALVRAKKIQVRQTRVCCGAAWSMLTRRDRVARQLSRQLLGARADMGPLAVPRRVLFLTYLLSRR